jgi:hypothetical protein
MDLTLLIVLLVLLVVGNVLLRIFWPKRKICAWCGKDLGPAFRVSNHTHGICPECLAETIREEDL